MKKILYLVYILLLPLPAAGQQTVDYLLKARALTEEGKTDLAISQLTQAISGINDSRLYIERADAEVIMGNYSGAISDYNEANKVTTSSGEYGLSRIYSLKGDAPTALYHLEKNLNSPFRKAEKEVMLDPAFGAIENKPEWRQFWKKDWYTEVEKDVSQIEYYISAGKPEDAGSLLADLKKNYRDNDLTFYGEALVDIASGKPAEAVKILSGLTAANPLNEKYLRVLARAQTAESNPSGASETYSQLIDLGVADAELLTLRAECYRKTGETDKALADLKKYLGYYPDSKSALSMAGKTEAAMGDNLKAIELFSTNLKLHPNDADCYVDRANAYFVSRSWNLAIDDYSMSLDLKPGNSDVWLNKGIALLSSGRKDDACHDFRRSLHYGNKRASEYISNNCIK